MIFNYLLTVSCLYREGSSLCRTLTKALIVWTTQIYVSCILFSYLYILNFVSVILLYIFSDLVYLSYVLISGRKNALHVFLSSIIREAKNSIQEIKGNRIDGILSLFIISFTLTMGIIACFAVPYNYDSIDYHAPRICQWIQNQSVLYYASHVTRQNFSTVLASYVGTYAYILTGHKTGAMCIVQYGAYVINLGLILHLCRYYGINRRLRELAAILWITLPVGWAESITPQNDQCAAVWLLVFITEIVCLIDSGLIGSRDRKKNREKYARIFVIALSIAMGYLTKPSVCFAMVIFLIWYLIISIKSHVRLKDMIMQCVVAGSLVFILICPQMIWNYNLTGSISADIVGKQQLVGTLRPDYLFVNMLKNGIYNYAFKIGCITNTSYIKQFLMFVGGVLRVDLNHVSISEGGAEFYCAHVPCYTCDAGIEFTLYTILSLVVIAIVILHKRTNMTKSQKSFIKCTLLSYVVLCIFLRWEGSITRYMIGYFAVIIVALAVMMQELVRICKRKWLVYPFIILLSLMLIMDVAYESIEMIKLHPVFPSKSALTMYNDRLDEYRSICEYINQQGITELGLIEPEAPIEYPLWTMLNKDIKIRHVNLRDYNPLSALERKDIVQDVILSSLNTEEMIECHGYKYNKVMTYEHWNIYMR